MCRGDEIHDLARTWSTIREKNPPLFSSKDEKKKRSLLEGREREREGKRCVPIILSASVRNIIL